MTRNAWWSRQKNALKKKATSETDITPVTSLGTWKNKRNGIARIPPARLVLPFCALLCEHLFCILLLETSVKSISTRNHDVSFRTTSDRSELNLWDALENRHIWQKHLAPTTAARGHLEEHSQNRNTLGTTLSIPRNHRDSTVYL